MTGLRSYFKFIFVFTLLTFQSQTFSQKISDAEIKKRIENYKADPRGPYKAIRWFCVDGTTVPANERCPQPGGVQRAQYKDEVINLQKSNQIYLGQILATTPFEDFWDETNQNSRFKQYMLEKYLVNNDNGWILRKAKFYRGSVQAEDEENWGIKFYDWLLNQNDQINSKYFLIRQSAKYIPHKGDDNETQTIRAVSKQISDIMPSFMDIRVKIHGRPDAEDLKAVKDFNEKNKSKIAPEVSPMFDQLIKDMENFYRKRDLAFFQKTIKIVPVKSNVKIQVAKFIDEFNKDEKQISIDKKLTAASELIYLIRSEIIKHTKPAERLALIDLSIQLEELIFNEVSKWKTASLDELLLKNYVLGKTAAACGFIEEWEWNSIENILLPPKDENIKLEKLIEIFDNSRRLLEWGAGMVNASFENAITLFEGFEPLVHTFSDDQIRSSMLLPLGQTVSQLGNKISEISNLSNQVLDIENQNDIRGLNPGFAFGELQVVTGSPEDVKVDPSKIYIFSRPPADLKPIAGIATVSEGNLVSHVQLLARNLGIPNAVVTQQNLNSLKKYSGQKIFYAVSRKGTVIMKTESQMTSEEKKLFEKKTRKEEIVSVPIDRLDLSQVKIVNLNKLRASDSGKLCGPKAANLGELKFLFPNNVVEGFVIPFGIFKAHMDQPMPGKKLSYWNFLSETFKNSSQMEEESKPKEQIEKYIFGRLEELREAIKNINLKPEFVLDIEDSFTKIFGNKIEQVPVFIRSDTNMEDLKDFSGAGLNLTVFNVRERSKILQGIRDVWASPYTERSYKWRQKYLNNPQNVFPSTLIIPSVNVDKSGVIITTGITSSNKNDITIAFSRGAGGAVEGQISESYLGTSQNKFELLSPSRETKYNFLPESGGVNKNSATFEKPILSKSELVMLKNFIDQVKLKLPESPGIDSEGPFDIELGIQNNKIWLFQVRPFVENKSANSSEYLNSITPKIPLDKLISLKEKI